MVGVIFWCRNGQLLRGRFYAEAEPSLTHAKESIKPGMEHMYNLHCVSEVYKVCVFPLCVVPCCIVSQIVEIVRRNVCFPRFMAV